MHIAITGAQILHDLAQLGDIGGSFFGATDVGTADDFHQSHTGAVEIHKGVIRIHVMHRFARVLLKVNALNAHHTRCTVTHFNEDFTFTDNRMVQLADLIALWQVRVEIVFAVKGRKFVYFSFQAKPSAHGLSDTFFIDHWQHARHAGIHKGHIRVGLSAKGG